MASVYEDAIDGLVTTLQANITGCKAFANPPDSVNAYPAAIILPREIDYDIAYAGNGFTHTLDILFLVSSGDDKQGFKKLYAHMDPVEVGKSVRRAVELDTTLAGKVDWAKIRSCHDIGRSENFGGYYMAAMFTLEFAKRIA